MAAPGCQHMPRQGGRHPCRPDQHAAAEQEAGIPLAAAHMVDGQGPVLVHHHEQTAPEPPSAHPVQPRRQHRPHQRQPQVDHEGGNRRRRDRRRHAPMPSANNCAIRRKPARSSAPFPPATGPGPAPSPPPPGRTAPAPQDRHAASGPQAQRRGREIGHVCRDWMISASATSASMRKARIATSCVNPGARHRARSTQVLRRVGRDAERPHAAASRIASARRTPPRDRPAGQPSADWAHP